MKRTTTARPDSFAVQTVAVEDLQAGDIVTVTAVFIEVASYHWDNDMLPPHEPVRVATTPRDAGMPLKVKTIYLPFIHVKTPRGRHLVLDVRRHRIVRLGDDYAKQVWKALKPRHKGKAK
jgi:hypothetical protein